MRRTCVVVLSFFIVSFLRAEETLLTWPGVVREANRNNPDLGAEKAALAKTEATLLASRSPFLPTLTGLLSMTHSPNDFYENSLTANQNVFNGFRDRSTYVQNRAQRDIARWQLETVRAQVSAELKSAFARLLFTQEAVTLTHLIAERRTMNTRSVSLRYDAGRENKGSYLRTAADEASSRYDEAQALRAQRVAQREMARVLGRSTFDQLIATGTLVTADPGTPGDFTTLARQTPSVQQAQLAIQSAEAGIGIAQSGFSPALNAQASGSRSGSQWPPASDQWSIGANLSIPFFNGGSTWYDRQKAVQEKKRAAFALTGADQQAAQDLEQAFATLQDAVSLVKVNQQYLDAAIVRADIARGQYANGLLSFQDWDLIENELVTRQKSRLQSVRDAQLAEAAWQKALGQTDPIWKEVTP